MLFEDIDPNAHIYCNNAFALRTFGCDTVFVFNDALSIFDATEKVKISLLVEDANWLTLDVKFIWLGKNLMEHH